MNHKTEKIEQSLFEEDALQGPNKNEQAQLDSSSVSGGREKLKKEIMNEEYTQELNEKPNEPQSQKSRPAKEPAGLILKRAREQKGLSLEIVHEATKIPLDALRAIEEGYKVRVLSPFYISGFLKMYATYLGVDLAEFVEEYKREELPEPVEDGSEEDIEIPQWVNQVFNKDRLLQIGFLGGGILGLFILFKTVSFIASLIPSPKPPDEPKTEQKVETIKTVKAEITQAGMITSEPIRQEAPRIEAPKIKTVVPAIKPQEVTPVPAQEAPKPPTPEPEVKPAVKALPVITSSKEIVLTVRANQNSWLRVRSDGNIVFQSTLRTGAVETWLADSEIEISGRNINRLEFELNGKMIGSLGRRDRNAKKIVITKDGLTVKQ